MSITVRTLGVQKQSISALSGFLYRCHVLICTSSNVMMFDFVINCDYCIYIASSSLFYHNSEYC